MLSKIMTLRILLWEPLNRRRNFYLLFAHFLIRQASSRRESSAFGNVKRWLINTRKIVLHFSGPLRYGSIYKYDTMWRIIKHVL